MGNVLRLNQRLSYFSFQGIWYGLGMLFSNHFKSISSKLDEILSLLRVKSEITSPKMAALAAKVLNDPKSTRTAKSLAGALLNQAPNRE